MSKKPADLIVQMLTFFAVSKAKNIPEIDENI